jgi:hypothetical protein
MRPIFGATSGYSCSNVPRFVPPPMARMCIGSSDAVSVLRRNSTALSGTGLFGFAGSGTL